jgi:hypothetical protein
MVKPRHVLGGPPAVPLRQASERVVDRTKFEARLRAASRWALIVAREYVRQPLPDEVAFRVYPNQSFDGNPLVGDEAMSTADSLPDGSFHGPWSVEGAMSYLWRDGKVPEWVDAGVEAVDGSRSLVSLRCCGRFTASVDLLYHRRAGLPPFSIKSPILPPGWESTEVSGRFDLHWWQLRQRRRRWWRLR